MKIKNNPNFETTTKNFFYTIYKNKENYHLTFRINFIPIVILLAIILLFSSFKIVPTGYTGVKTMFGQISDEVLQEGINFKIPFIEQVTIVNNKQDTLNFKDRIWGESSERTVVFIDELTITYRVNREYSAWICKNITDYKHNLISNSVVNSAMKSAMVALSSNEVTNRSKLEPLCVKQLQDVLNNKYGSEVVSIVNISIDNMDFEDSYNAAVAEKQIAQMNFEKQQIENDALVKKANAEAEQKRINAKAEADVKRINAEAEADAIKATAEAQAEANAKLAKSLSDELVEYEKIQNWNGVLPQVTGSDSIIMFNNEKEN